jgi:glycosyltransferase involved in cell wall biosynthesis
VTEAPVSVVIPAYNAETFVERAISTVLAQTVRPAEIIVVDDGSTDATAAAASRLVPAVRLVRSPHAGAGAARNVGLAHATRPLVALLDVDDTWAPTKLERQLALLRGDVAVVFCHARNVVAGDASERPAMAAPIPSALLARREVFAAVGPFDERLATAEWPDWYLRMTEAEVLTAVVAEVLVERHVHGENLGIRRRDHAGVYARVLKASLDRRRAAADVP